MSGASSLRTFNQKYLIYLLQVLEIRSMMCSSRKFDGEGAQP